MRRHAARRWVLLIVGLSFLLTLPPAAIAAGNAAPNTTISVPSAGQAFLPGSITFTGGATDDLRVASVNVAIQDAGSGLWRRSDGTWGAFQWLPASLGPAGRSTTWRYAWANAPEGRYVLHARAQDLIGAVDPTDAVGTFVVSEAATTRFLSILFGRTQWVSSSACAPLPGGVDLGTVAGAMAQRGLSGVGNVVIDRASGSATPVCLTQSLSATWGQIATLRDSYGWRFLSAGQSYRDMTLLSPADQWTESCGSLAALTAHGHTRAWGLFAYPNNKLDPTMQTNVVSTCFSYGRRYASGINTIGGVSPPWFQKTLSVNGGACNAIGAWCYDPVAVGAKYRYASPDTLVASMTPGLGEWRVVQFYRFVTGSYSGNAKWDCTSADWRDHWANLPELYCFDDFLSILDRLPSGITVTDPATIAETWGRGNPGG